ncbi:MBL fold metallo-hydrolase [Thermodesulfobacteriota bacterium]
MNKIVTGFYVVFILSIQPVVAHAAVETDTFMTSKGELVITHVGHGSLMFSFDNMIIHVDPFSKQGDYGSFPKADIVLITHEHRDHLDLQAVNLITKNDTVFVVNEAAAPQLPDAVVMKNGQQRTVKDVRIEAVAAYNLLHMRENGNPYHPRGNGNGYVVNFADKRVYVAGDTENIPEMKTLGAIDIAFLPMNLPYTMTPEMTADAAVKVHPKVLIPYHYGKTDTATLHQLLQGSGIEIRIPGSNAPD